MNVVKNLLNLLFPKTCRGCDSLLLKNEKTICSKCRHDLPFTGHLRNPDNEVMKRFYGRLPLQHASSIVYFHKKGMVQQLIHNLKYKGAQDVGTFFGNCYGPEIAQNELLKTVDAIIPVPLHPKRKRERGYNQLTTFGKTLSEELGIPFDETLLKRKQHTKTQTKKNISKRSEIDTATFDVVPLENDHRKHFLLIDDVITTGATLEACGKALLKIPGAKLSIVTIAYAQS
ncbi:ComF family protein [Flavobacterium pedocola]